MPVEEIMVSCLLATDGQRVLRICRPRGRRDLPLNVLRLMRLDLDVSNLVTPGEDTRLVQRLNEQKTRFVLLEAPLDSSVENGVAVEGATVIVRRCYELAQLEAHRHQQAERIGVAGPAHTGRGEGEMPVRVFSPARSAGSVSAHIA